MGTDDVGPHRLQGMGQPFRARRPFGGVCASLGAVAGGSGEGLWPKGIHRKFGENTCYVNAFIQFLFHAPGAKEKVMEAAAAVPPAGTRDERPQILLALAQNFRDLDDGKPR